MRSNADPPTGIPLGLPVPLPVRPAHILAIMAAVIVLYANTLHAPFQWDEHKFLVDNPFVTQGAPVESLRHDDELYKMVAHRYAGFLLFRLNYLIHGFSVEGYHVVNIGLHLCNSLLVYLFVLALFSTPRIPSSLATGTAAPAALCTALVFAVHPVQTEAVNYVHQRPALLAAFFYLLAAFLYTRWRTGAGASLNLRSLASPWYLGAVGAAVLAMKSKEYAFTLPLGLALLEAVFFTGDRKKRFLILLPLLATMLIIPLTALVGMDRSWALSTKTHAYLSRPEYFLTELRVMPTYLRILLFPFGQRLLYDYPRYSSVFSLPVLLSSFFLLSIGAGVVLLFRRASSAEPGLKLLGFGILWFFLALSIESSVFPTPYVIQEYRLYLPSFGIFLAAVSGGLILYRRFPASASAGRTAVVMTASLLALFLLAAHVRNRTWNDVIVFWTDNAHKSPELDIPHIKIGNEYYRQKRFAEAAEAYQAAVARDPGLAESRFNLGLAYRKLGMQQEALAELLAAYGLDASRYEIPLNIAIVSREQGDLARAEEFFRKVLGLKPDSAEAHTYLGVVLDESGRFDEAIAAFRTAVGIDPSYARAYLDMGIAYANRGRWKDAELGFQAALRLDPARPDVHAELAAVYEQQGRTSEAAEEYAAAIRLDPGNAKARDGLGRLTRP